MTTATYQVLVGDAQEQLRTLPAGSVHCVVTSPPYYGLRDYGVDGQIGLESTPQAYVAKLVEVFREVRRVLRDDGVVWLNLGDSYAGSWGAQSRPNGHDIATTIPGGSMLHARQIRAHPKGQTHTGSRKNMPGLKPKDLMGIPWRVAFALQEDGWYLRSDIIWCLSGGSVVYVQSQKGDMPMTIKDLARLDPSTVQLWNGTKWTRLRGVSKSGRRGDEITLVLRSGERIACTPTHRFPTERGIIPAGEVTIGDRLQRVVLPESDEPKDSVYVGTDAAWFAGLYLAEGSMSGDTIQIAGHAKEQARWERVLRIAEDYGGTATRTVEGNGMNIRVYGKVLVSLVRQLVAGKTAKDKGVAPVCWRYSNEFLRAYLDGYLSGDGHWDEKNGRWRIGFTRNYNLERDLRVLAARLGLRLTLNLGHAVFDGKQWPAFRGEIRFERSGHHNEACMEEVVRIEKAKARYVYDLGVEDEPHLFALASGILTHNSKPNPMPESVKDRPTRSHEYVFLLSKNARYYYDAQAIAEPAGGDHGSYFDRGKTALHPNQGADKRDKQSQVGKRQYAGFNARWDEREIPALTRNRRSVWHINTTGYPEAHFAVWPEKLVEPMVLAGCPSAGKRCDCAETIETPTGNGVGEDPSLFTGRAGFNRPRCEGEGRRPITRREQRWEANLMRHSPHKETMRAMCGDAFDHYIRTDRAGARPLPPAIREDFFVRGWLTAAPPCDHPIEEAGTVLDPFAGSGTTLAVANRLGRHAIGIELNPEYLPLIERRCAQPGFIFSEVGR